MQHCKEYFFCQCNLGIIIWTRVTVCLLSNCSRIYLWDLAALLKHNSGKYWLCLSLGRIVVSLSCSLRPAHRYVSPKWLHYHVISGIWLKQCTLSLKGWSWSHNTASLCPFTHTRDSTFSALIARFTQIVFFFYPWLDTWKMFLSAN